jgi:hypothetical protein
MTTPRCAHVLGIALLLVGCESDNIEHDANSSDEGNTGDALIPEDDFPARLAEAYCATLFSCDPLHTCHPDFGQPYPSEAACITGERGALEEAQAAARGDGLSYDPQCVDALIADYVELGCDGWQRLEARHVRSFECTPYYGTIPEHENPCFEVVGSNFSDCGRDLRCDEQMTCRPLPYTDCECEAGFDCILGVEDTFACFPIAALGEICSDEQLTNVAACGLDAQCAIAFGDEGDDIPPGHCVARVGIGEPCINSSDCETQQCSDAGTCMVAWPQLCDPDLAPHRWR